MNHRKIKIPRLLDNREDTFLYEALFREIESNTFRNSWVSGLSKDGLIRFGSDIVVSNPSNLFCVGNPDKFHVLSYLTSLTLRFATNSETDLYVFVNSCKKTGPFKIFSEFSNSSFSDKSNELAYLTVVLSELNKRASIQGDSSDLCYIFLCVEKFSDLIKCPKTSILLHEIIRFGPKYNIFTHCIDSALSIQKDVSGDFPQILLYKNDPNLLPDWLRLNQSLYNKILRTYLDIDHYISFSGEILRLPMLYYEQRYKLMETFGSVLVSKFLSEGLSKEVRIKNGTKSNSHKISSLLKLN